MRHARYQGEMDPEDDRELEPELARKLALAAPAVPPELDARILAAAETAAAARRRRSRRVLLGLGGAVAAAAAVIVALLVGRGPLVYARGDVNGDGQVDILDAHRLARGVEAGATQPSWDVDGDGRVDRADVDAATRAAVTLVAGPARASSPGGGGRDRAVEISLSSAAAVATWQLELVAGGDARVTGVEGGDAPFAAPPAHDPAALGGGRVVLAAFDTHAALPAGQHRVAVVHLRGGGAEPTVHVRLVVAGDARGERVSATPSI